MGARDRNASLTEGCCSQTYTQRLFKSRWIELLRAGYQFAQSCRPRAALLDKTRWLRLECVLKLDCVSHTSIGESVALCSFLFRKTNVEYAIMRLLIKCLPSKGSYHGEASLLDLMGKQITFGLPSLIRQPYMIHATAKAYSRLPTFL